MSTLIETGSILLPDDVRRIYAETEAKKHKPGIREDVLAMIGHYPRWEKGQWDQRAIGGLEIFNDRGSLGEMLTNRGQDLEVRFVAANFLQHEEKILAEHPDFYICIQKTVIDLENQREVPPLIVVPGSRYNHAPASPFIDGTKRAISSYVYFLQTGELTPVPVLLGAKAPLLERFKNKLAGFGSALSPRHA